MAAASQQVQRQVPQHWMHQQQEELCKPLQAQHSSPQAVCNSSRASTTCLLHLPLQQQRQQQQDVL